MKMETMMVITGLAFFVLNYQRNRHPRPEVSVFMSKEGMASSILKIWTLDALKWGLAGVTLLMALIRYLPPMQDFARLLLASGLCATIVYTYAPTCINSGYSPKVQNFRNTLLSVSAATATFLAGLPFDGIASIPLFLVIFMAVHMILDFALSALSVILCPAMAEK